MPCENCNTQFTIFKRKQVCQSCQRYYCNSCLGKKQISTKKKLVCWKCEIFLRRPSPAKNDLMQMKTKDLVFYLQWKKINFSGAVEKEELANLIINHANTSTYYETGSTHSSSSTPNDFENYAQSFDQIKQTCQNLFTSISDKIASDFQKTTCFNNSPNQPSRPHTQQPRPASGPIPTFAPQTPNTSSNEPSAPVNHDCECSDDEIEEISEKRNSIFNGNPGPSGCSSGSGGAKVAKSSSSDTSSFEEVEPKMVEENWELIEKTASNGAQIPEASGYQSTSTPVNRPISPGVRKVTRRRSDSSLLSLRKSSSIFLDTSAVDPTRGYDREFKKLKVSCNRCGKAKSKIKSEILKLSEQLLSSNKSEAEVNAKIKEFLDYLESKSQPSEMTETEPSESIDENLDGAQCASIPTQNSHDEIGANIFDENEGINVYASSSFETQQPPLTQDAGAARRFISLDDIHSEDDLESLSVKQLKEVLVLNRVDFKGCCEKKELKERVHRLWKSHVTATPSEKLPTDDLCKICMDAAIECVFLECGHSCTCVNCGKVLSECPLCRSYVVRVVRIFKS